MKRKTSTGIWWICLYNTDIVKPDIDWHRTVSKVCKRQSREHISITLWETRWVHQFLKVVRERLLLNHPISLTPEPKPQSPVVLFSTHFNSFNSEIWNKNCFWMSEQNTFHFFVKAWHDKAWVSKFEQFDSVTCRDWFRCSSLTR